MMKARPYRSELARSLTTPTAQRLYDEARQRHSILGSLLGLPHVLEALERSAGASDYAPRESLTRVCIEEAQSTHADVWIAVLMLAYEPMLTVLEARLVTTESRRERDQRVRLAFIEIVHSFPLARWTHHTAVRLRQQTGRAVFRQLREQRRSRESGARPSGAVGAEVGLSAFSGGAFAVTDELQSELVATLHTHMPELSAEQSDLLLRTCIGDETLTKYVARVFAHLPEPVRARKYFALRRERQRLRDELGASLQAACRQQHAPATDSPAVQRCAL